MRRLHIPLAVALAFILGGAYLLYFEADLNRWVSIGVLMAGFLLFIGLAVMSFASGAPADKPATVVKESTTPVRVDARPTVVQGDDRRSR